jgi:hypothetical protein
MDKPVGAPSPFCKMEDGNDAGQICEKFPPSQVIAVIGLNEEVLRWLLPAFL